MSKKCKVCGQPRDHDNPLVARCKKCQYEHFYNNKKQTRINLVSDKKKERLKNGGSEIELFKEIWNERKRICEECGKILKEPKAHNFDHIIPKSRGEKYRLDKSNIKIVCFACHFLKTTGLNYKGPDLD